MERSEHGLQIFHLGQALRGLMTPAWEALATTLRDGNCLSGDVLWSVGSVFEASGLLCLGCDLGYFPREETAAALRPRFGPRSLMVLALERQLMVSNGWTEHLAAGDIDQALAIRPFADVPGETRALQPAFQSVWSFAARLAANEPFNLFQRALLSGDEEWQRHGLGGRENFAAIRLDDPIWRQLAQGHPLDGLIALLNHLQVLAFWAASTRSVEGFDESPKAPGLGAKSSPHPSPFSASLLVSSIGKLLRWRLDRANPRVIKRLDEAIDRADELLPTLMAATGYTIRDAWPQGFRAAMEQALRDWDEISGEEAFRGPTAPSNAGSPAVSEMEPARPSPSVEFEVGLGA